MRNAAFTLLLVVVCALAAPCAPAVKTQSMPAPIPAENGMVVVQIPVDNMAVADAVAQARLLTSPSGVVIGDERLHRLVIKDRPENIERIRAHLARADVALPMVRLAVDFDASSRDSATRVGVDGAAVVNGRVYARGSASAGSARTTTQGTMSVVTMSGSEGVITVGENVPYPLWSYFFDAGVRLGYVAPTVVFGEVSTGFGVVPRVVGTDEVVLRVYPRVAYQSAAGPGVLRFVEAGSEVRVRSGQSVRIGGGSSDTQGSFARILATGGFSSSQGGGFTVTPTIMRP
jgi:type II secretory pathway component GspD/PulD (secretin)